MSIGNFKLKKQAKAGGGDRYTGELGGDTLDIYIPQVVSRPDGASEPLPELVVTVTPVICTNS